MFKWCGFHLNSTVAGQPSAPRHPPPPLFFYSFPRPDGGCERSQLGVPMLRPWCRTDLYTSKGIQRQQRRKSTVHCLLELRVAVSSCALHLRICFPETRFVLPCCMEPSLKSLHLVMSHQKAFGEWKLNLAKLEYSVTTLTTKIYIIFSFVF